VARPRCGGTVYAVWSSSSTRTAVAPVSGCESGTRRRARLPEWNGAAVCGICLNQDPIAQVGSSIRLTLIMIDFVDRNDATERTYSR
jgi:hypothetical protein